MENLNQNNIAPGSEPLVIAILGPILANWLNSIQSPQFSQVEVFSSYDLSFKNILSAVLTKIERASLIFIHDCGDENLEPVRLALKNLRPEQKLLQLSWDPLGWGGAEPAILAQAHQYLNFGGPENALLFRQFLMALAKNSAQSARQPEPQPFFGFYHPFIPENCAHYESARKYLSWYFGPERKDYKRRGVVALIFQRFHWAMGHLAVERAIIRALEAQQFVVLPIFAEWVDGSQTVELENALNGKDGLKPDLIVKLIPAAPAPRKNVSGWAKDSPTPAAVELFAKLGVPVIQPLVSQRFSLTESREDPKGLGPDTIWTMTMNEFEGAINPILVGGLIKENGPGQVLGLNEPDFERIKRLARRARKWVDLALCPIESRKIAFILPNNPCEGLEASLGVTQTFNAAESLARLTRAMKKVGYRIDFAKTGRTIIHNLLAKKAVPASRWTSAQQIVKNGGALGLVSKGRYVTWFEQMPPKVQEEIYKVWGTPSEELKNPNSPMIYEGRAVIPGLRLGPQIVVLAEPKRGCAGTQCDGPSCQLLKDPLVPPPLQYLAVYKWLTDPETFGAQVIVHLGGPSDLERLPGKTTGLTRHCYGDVALSDTPNIHIFDSQDVEGGLMAKRRGAATLISHLPPMSRLAWPNEDLAFFEEYMVLWNIAQDKRREQVAKKILAKVQLSGLGKVFGDFEGDLSKNLERLGAFLALYRKTYVDSGPHALGDLPKNHKLGYFLSSILRHEPGGKASIRHLVARNLNRDLAEIQKEPGEFYEKYHSNSQDLAQIDDQVDLICLAKAEKRDIETIAKNFLLPKSWERDREAWRVIDQKMEAIIDRLADTGELEAVIKALSGAYIAPAPSAKLQKCRYDVLPTGRNFFTQDPKRIPTPKAEAIGRQLAEATILKYRQEQATFPKTVAFYWLTADILQNNGEQLAQMLALMGLKPRRSEAGSLIGFEVIPLAELGRPRIDVLIRASAVVTDTFYELVSQLDQAIKMVAELDEPGEENFIRQRSLENLAEYLKADPSVSEADSWLRATKRIFGPPRGSLGQGVYLAIRSSAWTDQNELANIYVQNESLAFDPKGLIADPEGLRAALQQVDINFITLDDPAHDFLGSSQLSGFQGALSLAARVISGRAPRNYCGESLDPLVIEVRSLSEEIARAAYARLFNPYW
ncbi:MAG: cobaltochelatase subunit CobN, partial [Deltaproteobacteria bacterium]|nr:cobaltochelatase subunit CobN [Deltaproteobacteria bacterium]